MPTIRESNGLALSSRNSRLNPEQRENAGFIYRLLTTAKDKLIAGYDFEVVKNELKEKFQNYNGKRIDYLELVKLPEFLIVNDISSSQLFALCIAVYIDDIRLIDNIFIMD